jgi:ABC-type spermidine/putrescine transport system permease subunit I
MTAPSTAEEVTSSVRLPPKGWQPDMSLPSAVMLVGPLLFLLAVFFIWPLIRLVIISFTQPSVGLENYVNFFTRPMFTRSAIKTYWVSFLVTGAALLGGSILAWELRTTRSQLKSIILWVAILLPLWMSTIIRNYAFTILLQRKGIINQTFLLIGIIDEPVKLLYTDGAVFLGILYYMLPYAVLPLYAMFIRIDEDLVRAAQSLGASYLGAFFSVVVPLSIPGFLATGAIVFVVALGFYITPLLLGGPQSQFIANAISIQIFNLFDLPGAAASGVLLVSSAIICLGLAWRTVGWERIRRTLA